MKRVLLALAAIGTALLLSYLIYMGKVQETVQIWKGYNVVYVSSSFSDTDTVTLLEDAGITGLITRKSSVWHVANHYLPTLGPYRNEGFSSESMRAFFFFDRSKDYFLIYVPEEQLKPVAETLKKAEIPFGYDTTVTYPIFCPLICLAFFLLLMLFNRIAFFKAVSLIPIVAVTYSAPFYPVAAAVISFMYVFCVIDLYACRKHAARQLVKHISLWGALVAGTAAVVLSGTEVMILFAEGMAASALLLAARYLIKKQGTCRYDYQPVRILTAPFMNIASRLNLKTVLIGFTGCLVLFILAFFSTELPEGNDEQGLFLPSPMEYTEHEGFDSISYAQLKDMHQSERNPDLTDFLNERWYADTAAYRKVREGFVTAEAGQKVLLPTFVDEDGLFVRKDTVVYSFDDLYISKAADEYKDAAGVERLLVSQDRPFSTGYAATGKKTTGGRFVQLTTGICTLLFLLLLVALGVKRLRK